MMIRRRVCCACAGAGRSAFKMPHEAAFTQGDSIWARRPRCIHPGFHTQPRHTVAQVTRQQLAPVFEKP
jgi:hypothetical protein